MKISRGLVLVGMVAAAAAALAPTAAACTSDHAPGQATANGHGPAAGSSGLLGGNNAEGQAAHSPGVLSGNRIQVPVHVPVNACGNTDNVIGLLNPAFGNVCANG